MPSPRSDPAVTEPPPASGHPRLRPLGLAVAALAVATLVLVGCGTSGRTLRDPVPGATAPPRTTGPTTTTAVIGTTPPSSAATTAATVAPAAFAITSSAWAPGGAIPAEYSCTGTATSPPLTIEGVPAGTAELVLVVRDTDDNGYRQWVVAGIPPEDPTFPAGGVPAGATQLYNDGDVTSWRAPCAKTATHTYEFTVYALPQPSGLTLSSRDAALQAAVDGAISSAVMTGTYVRG